MKLGQYMDPTADPALFWKRVCKTSDMCNVIDILFLEEQKLNIAEGLFQKAAGYQKIIEE